MEDTKESIRQLAKGKISGPKSSKKKKKKKMPGQGMEIGVTVQHPFMSRHDSGLGCHQLQVNPRNPYRN